MRLDSSVVQIDKADDKLLVSTMTRCFLCDTVRWALTAVLLKNRNFTSQRSLGGEPSGKS